jgi:hypothetical protein
MDTDNMNVNVRVQGRDGPGEEALLMIIIGAPSLLGKIVLAFAAGTGAE